MASINFYQTKSFPPTMVTECPVTLNEIFEMAPNLHIANDGNREELPNQRIPEQYQGWFMQGLSLPQICKNLVKAANDPRVEGVLLSIEPLSCGWGKLDEIKRHLEYYKQFGKFLVGYMAVGGEEYYLASVCPELYAPPGAYISIQRSKSSRSNFSVISLYLYSGVQDWEGLTRALAEYGMLAQPVPLQRIAGLGGPNESTCRVRNAGSACAFTAECRIGRASREHLQSTECWLSCCSLEQKIESRIFS